MGRRVPPRPGLTLSAAEWVILGGPCAVGIPPDEPLDSVRAGLVDAATADLLVIVVTLSMILTPLLIGAHARLEAVAVVGREPDRVVPKPETLRRLAVEHGLGLQGTGLWFVEDLLETLEAAVDAGAPLLLTYDAGDRGELTRRVVDPLRLEWWGWSAVLIAHCRLRGTQRVFRLDRIISVRPAAPDADEAELDDHTS